MLTSNETAFPSKSAVNPTSIEVGSNNSVPFFPVADHRSAFPSNLRRPLLETSALPPRPPFAPPLAEISPLNVVTLSDQITTEPPSETGPRPFAERVVAASTIVSEARCKSPLP